ncbi:glycosyltransferase family 2 protein [Gilvimarinus japonicus]|uniref:Glycosyltransferase family 2 protein n=1 Tax=Gilvimarinus japonicus TaxID=1796469 RepID=A0ABV7HQ58_9GAMM
MSVSPTVSVIIAAYNRPSVVSTAIKSVLNSDFQDFELIVVGDGCNQETEEAICAFTDPRILFYNLPENTGHQSAPHNKGIEMASGEFILFLNQDDLYFPDHISRRVAFMRESKADISWSPILLLQRTAANHGPVDAHKDRIVLDGAVQDNKFDPNAFIISSCWAVRREICLDVGPWLPIKKTRLSPSQEWLFRAWKQGCDICYHREASVLCIHSGVRPYSYIHDGSFEHERAWGWISAGADARSRVLNAALVEMAGREYLWRQKLTRFQKPLLSFARHIAKKLGQHPDVFQRLIGGLGKGAWVKSHTKFTRGTPPVLEVGKLVPFSAAYAEEHVGLGWHHFEKEGAWSEFETAELFFSTEQDAQTIILSGYPFRHDDKVTFTLNSDLEHEVCFSGKPKNVAILIPKKGRHLLQVEIVNPTSPAKLGLSDDTRTLAFWLSSFTVADKPVSVVAPKPS